MAVVRSFIALEIEGSIQQRLGGVVARLQPRLSDGTVRWVAQENVHLTLIFLGNISEKNLSYLLRELKSECAQHAPFEFSVGELGAFPSTSRPRVIWVGIQSPPSLLALQAGLQQRLERLGYKGEEREYSPHLTLGRVNKNIAGGDLHQISAAIQAEQVGFLGTVQAAEVLLMRSDLKPGGPVYTIMEHFPLVGLQ